MIDVNVNPITQQIDVNITSKKTIAVVRRYIRYVAANVFHNNKYKLKLDVKFQIYPIFLIFLCNMEISVLLFALAIEKSVMWKPVLKANNKYSVFDR